MKKATGGAVANVNQHDSHTLATKDDLPWFRELQRLTSLEKSLAFLPVGWGADKKAPMLKGWPSHPGFTTQQLTEVQGIRSVGAKTGISSGHLLCFDIDGKSAMDLLSNQRMEPNSVKTWQVHRDNCHERMKVLFRPTLEQIAQLPDEEFQGKTLTRLHTNSSKGEALEVFFYGGRQVIILGEHPSSGGNYFWPEGLGPEALSAPPDAWWELALEIAIKANHLSSSGSSSRPTSARNGTRRLEPCPICGRHSGGGNALWCEEATNGLIFCMPGSTFNADPSGTMKLGTVVNSYALVKRTTRHGIDYLTFTPHKPHRRHRRKPGSYIFRNRGRAKRG